MISYNPGTRHAVSDGSNFSRAPFGVLTVQTSNQHSRWSFRSSSSIACARKKGKHSRWSGRSTLIFRHDTGRHIWSGCVSLHQAPWISCLLDFTVPTCLCGECFSLFHSTLLEGDRAARGGSLFQKTFSLSNLCELMPRFEIEECSNIPLHSSFTAQVPGR